MYLMDIVIPFLLATDLVSNDDAWNNGPEYTFSVSANTISNVGDGKDDRPLLGTSLVTTLKCRPREPDDLNCYFEDTKIAKLMPKKFDFEEALPPKNASFRYYRLSQANFEIKFNRNGIEGYIFESDERRMGQFLVDMFRMLANQLSVGTSLHETSESFRKRENFTMGECPADYTIVRSRLDGQCEKKKFNLLTMVDIELNSEDVIEIEKERVLDQCIPRDYYYFGTRGTYGVVLSDFSDKLVSSMSQLIISKHCFVSETLNTVDIYDTDERKLGSALDRIRVTLESIRPAHGSVKPIADPVSADVIVRSPSNYGLN